MSVASAWEKQTSKGNNDPFAFTYDECDYDSYTSKEGGYDEYERVQQLKAQSINNQLDSTNRALASIYESEAMGVRTAEELLSQRDQLDNVENKLDKINQDMKTSQRHLDSIKSVFGGIKNWWQGKDKAGPAKTEPVKSEPSSQLTNFLESDDLGQGRKYYASQYNRADNSRGFYDDDNLDDKFMAGAAPQKQGKIPSRQEARPTNSGQDRLQMNANDIREQEFQENLELMSSGMTRLKGLAVGLGNEIESQNTQIERITTKADRSDIKLKDQNRQMRKILK